MRMPNVQAIACSYKLVVYEIQKKGNNNRKRALYATFLYFLQHFAHALRILLFALS